MYLKNIRAPEGRMKVLHTYKPFLELISDISERHLNLFCIQLFSDV